MAKKKSSGIFFANVFYFSEMLKFKFKVGKTWAVVEQSLGYIKLGFQSLQRRSWLLQVTTEAVVSNVKDLSCHIIVWHV